MGKNNSKDLLLKAMREDKESKIRSILEKDTSIKDEYINGNKTTQLFAWQPTSEVSSLLKYF
jgi:hypothetical protein